LTSLRELHEPFDGDSDRERDDKVPEGSGHFHVPFSRRATTETSMPFASLTGLKNRLRNRVDSAARGSDVPAGIERGADAVAPAGRRDRIRMRRRLRELRRLREAQLLELGALVVEAQKHGRDEAPIVKTKAAEAAATDAEARALADALETDAGVDRIVAEGIAGPCPTCGTLTSTAARFCSTCGTPLDGRPDAAPRVDAEAAPETPLTDARHVDAREADAPAADAHDADAPRPADAPAEADVPAAYAPADAPVPAADAPAEADAPAADPADSDAATTELRPGNGNGGSPEEVRARTGRES
jgi:hypothetical protein